MLNIASELYSVSSESRILHNCAPSFDPSVLEWMLAFNVGATLVVVPPSVLGGSELADLIRSERVSHAIITPAVLGTMDPDTLPDLEVVSVGGDVTSPDLLRQVGAGKVVLQCVWTNRDDDHLDVCLIDCGKPSDNRLADLRRHGSSAGRAAESSSRWNSR